MKDEELDLWRRYREGDQDAIKELMKYHALTVRFWVNRVMSVASGVDHDELIQEGMLGLRKAIPKFDPGRGYEFSTYAMYYIQEALYNYLRASRKLPRHLYRNFKKVKKAQETLKLKLGYNPSEAEVAKEAGLTLQQMERAIDATGIAFPEELVEPDTERVSVESPETILLVRQLLARLSERDRKVLIEYYYFGRTDNEIAELLGLKKDTVKSIRRLALQRMRAFLEEKPGDKQHED